MKSTVYQQIYWNLEESASDPRQWNAGETDEDMWFTGEFVEHCGSINSLKQNSLGIFLLLCRLSKNWLI